MRQSINTYLIHYTEIHLSLRTTKHYPRNDNNLRELLFDNYLHGKDCLKLILSLKW